MTTTPPNPEQVIEKWSKLVTEELDADIYLYAGGVYNPSDRLFSNCVRQNVLRTNVVLYLATLGGSADTAYRIARCLQTKYPNGKFILHVVVFCKSAGTLIALGASELVISDDAELGPLDVQISKPDSLAERISGLTPIQAMSTLRAEAFRCFEECFLEMIDRSKGQITTRTASMIAVKMTTGLFRPIYAQIDPMRLGEYQRSMRIAQEYGTRLNRYDNLTEDGLDKLIAGYPSHEFVIDREEAESLFKRVRQPSEAEAKLGALLTRESLMALGRQPNEAAHIRCLNVTTPTTPTRKTDETQGIPTGLATPSAGKEGGASTPASATNGRRSTPKAATNPPK